MSQLLPQLEGNDALGSAPHSCKTKPACAHQPQAPLLSGRPELREEAGLRTDNLGTVVVLLGEETGAVLALGLRWQGATASRGAGSWVSSPRQLLAGPSKPGGGAGPLGLCKF